MKNNFILLPIFCVIASQAFAQNGVLPGATSQPDAQPQDGFYLQFLNMLATLGVILFVFLLITYLLKRFLSTRLIAMNDTSTIKILEHRALSTRTSVYLLDIMGQGIAIAESQTGVIKLTEFDVAAEQRTFAQILKEKELKE